MAKKRKERSGDAEPLSFEEATCRLEAIVHDLEEGQIPLAESLVRYEEGVRLLKQCFDLLDRAQKRIERLGGVDADGVPTTEPFDDDTSEALEEKAKSRSRRRSRDQDAERRPSRCRHRRIEKPSFRMRRTAGALHPRKPSCKPCLHGNDGPIFPDARGLPGPTCAGRSSPRWRATLNLCRGVRFLLVRRCVIACWRRPSDCALHWS